MKFKVSFFLFFLVSGFCSLLYEVVWTRLAMAHFGVTTIIISIVLSVFMLGFALGSFAAGRLCNRLQGSSFKKFLLWYACCELFIAFSSFAVIFIFGQGRNMLLQSKMEWDSLSYTSMSALLITLALLPWTTCMGATFPLGIAILRRSTSDSQKSFSFLYLANVLGATLGTIASAFILIELFGFTCTLIIAGILNAFIVVFALALLRVKGISVSTYIEEDIIQAGGLNTSRWPLILLFLMGVVSLSLEVIWIRLYTPFLNSYIYTFAAILATYLASTYIGSLIYRAKSSEFEKIGFAPLWISFGVACSLPLIFTDPRILLGDDLMRLLGIIPCCILMGMLTPQLVDRWSSGSPHRAGFSYSVNVIGCIIGPIVSSFLLIPWLGERLATTILALLILCMMVFTLKTKKAQCLLWSMMVFIVLVFGFCRTTYDLFQSNHPEARTIRDPTATITALGHGFKRHLLVNGCAMTSLTPICKVMTHMPLAMRAEKPKKILIICFGMGTAFRSALSWEADVTSVELVPGVYKLFNFYHADADEIIKKFSQKMIVDDGRRYLERTREKYDLIVVDPAPPLQSAGSSLLYSAEFLSLTKEHLTATGVLAHWLPENRDDPATNASFAKSMKKVFPHVRVYRSLGQFGHHLFASLQPLEEPNIPEMLKRMPPTALRDWMEWDSYDSSGMFQEVLSSKTTLEDLIIKTPAIHALEDNHPINEYFLLRWVRLIRW